MNYLFSRPLIAGVVLSAIALSACSSGPNIRSDYDKATDFGAYRTYAFMDGAGPHAATPDGQGYQTLFSQYMIAAITTEMNNRGYVTSNNPDLLVNFNAILQEKTKVTQTPSTMPMGGYYGYRGGMYAPWGGYGYGTETNVSQYTEGTFNIDLVDAKKKQLVWEAVSVGRITDKKLANLQESVDVGVQTAFQQYPFHAGDPTPLAVK